MDDENAGSERSAENLISRPPTEEDLIALCRELNQRSAKYVVVGGLAIIAAGLPRTTTDVDLMVAVDAENEEKIYAALATLPDKAVCELKPGELSQYTVVRVGDEILIDLMRSAGGTHREKDFGDLVFLRQWFAERGEVPPQL